MNEETDFFNTIRKEIEDKIKEETDKKIAELTEDRNRLIKENIELQDELYNCKQTTENEVFNKLDNNSLDKKADFVGKLCYKITEKYTDSRFVDCPACQGTGTIEFTDFFGNKHHQYCRECEYHQYELNTRLIQSVSCFSLKGDYCEIKHNGLKAVQMRNEYGRPYDDYIDINNVDKLVKTKEELYNYMEIKNDSELLEKSGYTGNLPLFLDKDLAEEIVNFLNEERKKEARIKFEEKLKNAKKKK